MQTELAELEEEIEWYRNEEERHEDDQFLPTTEGFVVETRASFRNQRKLLDKMKNCFKSILEYFGEDSKGVSTDEFFGNFSTFLQSFQVRIHLYSCCCFLVKLD